MHEPLDRFRLVVLGDRRLQDALLTDDDPVRFAVRVVALAHVHGIDLDVGTVRREVEDARRRRRTRWL